jgi:hypothetical protein
MKFETALILYTVLLALLMVGCSPHQYIDPHQYIVRGTVMNVQCPNVCGIVFQHDTGETTIIKVKDIPPVWTGYRCQMLLTTTGIDEYDTLISVAPLMEWE